MTIARPPPYPPDHPTTAAQPTQSEFANISEMATQRWALLHTRSGLPPYSCLLCVLLGILFGSFLFFWDAFWVFFVVVGAFWIPGSCETPHSGVAKVGQSWLRPSGVFCSVCLGFPRAHMGSIWAHMGPIWTHMGSIWACMAHVEPIWAHGNIPRTGFPYSMT